MNLSPTTQTRVLPAIPPRRLRSLDNQTPFRTFQFDKMGPGRRFFDVVIVKATFVLAPGRLTPAESIRPFRLSDEPWVQDDAERSSLRHAGDLLLVKPTTDVVVTGSVHAPRATPTPAWETGIAVRDGAGTLASHVARVTGPREFHRSRLGGWLLSDPVPTTEVPIRYELAYGGPSDGSFEDRSCRRRPGFRANPSGCGETLHEPDGRTPLPAPRWTLPGAPTTAPNRLIPVAGFGPVARHWSARTALGGTYDATWRRNASLGAIDYPKDFDLRFFQCAPRPLQTARLLRGSEWIGIQNGARGFGDLVTQLPCLGIVAHLETPSRALRVLAALDTVTIDLDGDTVDLVWRLPMDQTNGIERCTLESAPIPA